MEDPSSRYSSTGTAFITLPDGRTVAYRLRRFLPKGQSLPLLAEVRAARDERLDLFAHRTIGDPEQFWQICDANDVMRPEELTAGEARLLRIGSPQFPGGATAPEAAAATLSFGPGGQGGGK
jgi:hypothetical protein